MIEWLAFVFQTHDMEPVARIFMLLCGYGGPEINWFEKIISSLALSIQSVRFKIKSN